MRGKINKIKICPSCRKAGISMFIGWQTGNYKCNKCGYIGPIVVEIEKKENIKKKSKLGKKKNS